MVHSFVELHQAGEFVLQVQGEVVCPVLGHTGKDLVHGRAVEQVEIFADLSYPLFVPEPLTGLEPERKTDVTASQRHEERPAHALAPSGCQLNTERSEEHTSELQSRGHLVC